MSAIFLSSSPPRIFAASPTPIKSSSPLPSPTAILNGDYDCRKRFKSATVQRYGFTGGFSNARTLLGTKRGAENIPITSPGKARFKSSKSSQEPTAEPSSSTENHEIGPAPVLPRSACRLVGLHEEDDIPAIRPAGGNDAPARDEHLGDSTTYNKNKTASGVELNVSSLNEKALPRRNDWTPVKDRPTAKTSHHDEQEELVRSFPNNLLGSFHYEGDANPKDIPDELSAAKRRKVTASSKTSNSTSELKPTNNTVPKKKKPPAKKALTITGLATSNHAGNKECSKTTAILDLVTTTQEQVFELDEDSSIPKAVAPKRGKVTKATKTKPQKPKLKSPQTALRLLQQQETVFGSASQLARDESPTVIRDTLEALKRSEQNLTSDPVYTQQTELVSVGSTTPAAGCGTSRFVRTRNLWGAAGRDEDNALLHMDAIDLCDTPVIRLAFAGKDVLTEPITKSIVPEHTHLSLRGGSKSPGKSGIACLYDVDDFASPMLKSNPKTASTSAQSYHTTTAISEDATTPIPINDPSVNVQTAMENQTAKVAKTSVARKPRKPSYAGFTIHELQKRISAFGFKPVKKREKMIELLDRCWEETHGTVSTTAEEDDSSNHLKQSDFLSKVHDVSARPVPKIKKPRKRKSTAKDDTETVKEPKRRKKADPKPKETKPGEPKSKEPKPAKKRVAKSKSSRKSTEAVSTEVVVETTEVLNPSIVEDHATSIQRSRASIPPSTIPLQAVVSSDSADNFTQHELVVESSHSEPPVKSIAIGTKIKAAILCESRSPSGDRDHVRNPTWHEKILLYDPIILEDLTKWLNTEGFKLINEDNEVDALQVRSWCESNGICCLWKGGWRGQKTKNGED